MNAPPYTLDRWATPDDPEIGSIRFADLRKIERACQRIWAIARIVGNSANEPDSTGGQPLDPWVTSNLLGGLRVFAITLRIWWKWRLMGRRWVLGSGQRENLFINLNGSRELASLGCQFAVVQPKYQQYEGRHPTHCRHSSAPDRLPS